MNVGVVSNVVGVAGVALIALMYFLLQADLVDADRPVFSALNALGAVLIIFSLWIHWNLPSVIMEGFWLAISVYGLVKAVRADQPSAAAE